MGAHLVGYDVDAIGGYPFAPVRPVLVNGGSRLIERFEVDAEALAASQGANTVYILARPDRYLAGVAPDEDVIEAMRSECIRRSEHGPDFDMSAIATSARAPNAMCSCVAVKWSWRLWTAIALPLIQLERSAPEGCSGLSAWARAPVTWRAMIVIDTSLIYALLDRADQCHRAAADWYEREQPEVVTTPLVLAEVDHLAATRAGPAASAAWRADLADGAYLVEWWDGALRESVEVANRYRDLQLGLTDASLVALAARITTTEVATFDERHFRVVRPADGARAFRLLPLDRP